MRTMQLLISSFLQITVQFSQYVFLKKLLLSMWGFIAVAAYCLKICLQCTERHFCNLVDEMELNKGMTVYYWLSKWVMITPKIRQETHTVSGYMVSHDNEAVAMLSVLHVHIYSTKWVKQGIQADLVKTSQHKFLINP